MIYLNQILIKNNPNIEQSKKYLYFKKLYSLLKLVSSITSKLYLDKIIDITDLEIILKILIIFTVNDNYKDIKENSDIKNFMYFKECLNILVISFNKKDTDKTEQKFLVDIFNFMNNSIIFRDKNNTNLNYTNKIYLLHNDYKTTKLLKLMKFIHKINNKDLTNIFFEFLINIYYFQFSYNNFTWQFYELFQPLLENIKEKKYERILNEVSFLGFKFNFLIDLISRERNFINNNVYIFKNAFYFSGKQQNSGILADIGKIQQNFLLAFGFNLTITDEPKAEYIIFQIKNYEQKLQLKASILKNNEDLYFLYIFDSSSNKDKYCWKIEIQPNYYYPFVLTVEKGKNINVSFFRDEIFYEEKFKI